MIIGTLLNLCPSGRVKTTQTGGQIIKPKKSNITFHAVQFRLPLQSSWKKLRIIVKLDSCWEVIKPADIAEQQYVQLLLSVRFL